MIVRVLLCVSVASAAMMSRLQRSLPTNEEEQQTQTSGQSEFFTSEWRELYSEDALFSQPKWRLVKGVTSQSDYQIREYVNIQWADTTSCFNESKATSFRKKMHKSLSKPSRERKNAMLLPLVIKAFNPTEEGLPSFGLEMDEIEQCRYTFQFYYPIFGASNDFDFSIDYANSSIFYVMSYAGNYTIAHCNEKADQLGKLLEKDRKKYIHSTWKCAQYEPGIGSKDVLYEVWLQKPS